SSSPSFPLLVRPWHARVDQRTVLPARHPIVPARRAAVQRVHGHADPIAGTQAVRPPALAVDHVRAQALERPDLALARLALHLEDDEHVRVLELELAHRA